MCVCLMQPLLLVMEHVCGCLVLWGPWQSRSLWLHASQQLCACHTCQLVSSLNQVPMLC